MFGDGGAKGGLSLPTASFAMEPPLSPPPHFKEKGGSTTNRVDQHLHVGEFDDHLSGQIQFGWYVIDLVESRTACEID
jgi:hypothetical protein